MKESQERGTNTTICLRASRGLRMNFRVRNVTCESAMVGCVLIDGFRQESILAKPSKSRSKQSLIQGITDD